MGIFPDDETLQGLLLACGKEGLEDVISFELFARTVALLLEENIEKISTSSKNEGEGQEEVEYQESKMEPEYM